MYDRKTMDKEKIVKVLVDDYKYCLTEESGDMATLCSVILHDLVGLRICLAKRGKIIEVYNQDTFTTEYKFDKNTGKEIK